MISLSTLEVNRNGKVLSASVPTSSVLNGLFPAVDGNITTQYDEPTNELMKAHLEAIFNSSLSNEFTIVINNFHLQCTAYNYSEDRAFIYFKLIEQSTSEELQYVILKKNEAERLKLAEFSFQNVYSPIAFIREDGSFFYFNEATATLFGYSMEEFGHLTVFDISGTYNPAQWKEQWDEIRHNKRLTLFSKLQKNYGSWMDVEVRSNRISFGDLELNCTFYTDITEKKKIEEQLKLVDFTFRNATTAIQLIRDDNTIYDFNEAMPFMLGYTKEEYKYITIMDLDPYTNAEGWAKLWNNLKKVKVLEVQRKLIRKDGTLIDVEMCINLIKYGDIELNCAFISEITEKKKITEQLKLVDFAFRNSATAKHFFDKQGHLYDFNLAACQLLGYTSNEYHNLTINNISTKDNPETLEDSWEKLKRTQGSLHTTKLRKKDNTVIDVEIRTDIFEYGSHQLGYSSFINITEKVKLEERLKLVDFTFRNVNTAIHFVKKDGTYYDCNNATEDLLGYKRQELMALEIFDVNPSIKKQYWTNIWDELKEQVVNVFYTKLKKKDGSLIDTEIKTRFIEYDGLQLICSFITDITVKKKIDERLNLVDFVFKNANISILMATEDALIYDFNEHAYTSRGYTKDEMMRMKITDLNKNISAEVWPTHWEKLKALGADTFLAKHQKKDGTMMDVEIYSRAINYGGLELICSFITDITEKKKEELRLKLLESVITNTNEAVVITEAEPIESPGPSIVFVNDAYTRMTGYTFKEVVGQSPRITQNAKTNRKELDKVAIAFKNWESFDMTVLNSTKSGEEFWVNVRATPIADEKGWFTHWVAIQRNVTKEKEAEEEKQKLLDELIENNNELVQFSYITTHNLRAPLTNLISICKKIDTKFVEDAKTVKFIEGFKQSTMLLNDTLNDLIRILIIKENRNIAIDHCVFEEILVKVKTSISTILLKNVVKIETDFAEATVSFVLIYLESIFLNLLTNAIKYANPTRYPLIKIRTFKDEDGYTKLTFSDNGRGMNIERVKNKIFGLYQRFHSNADGKGIGLYLIHSQITALGGKIEVESEEGIGTTFTITFK
jgi:PAS domain S-box-containing protein